MSLYKDLHPWNSLAGPGNTSTLVGVGVANSTIVNKHTNHHGNTSVDTTSHSLTGGSRTLEVGEVTGGHD